jgi:hypothetical protein
MTENSINGFSDKKQIFCNYCRVVTNHNLKAVHHQDHFEKTSDGALQAQWDTDYLFWVCSGCDTAILEQKNLSNIDYDGNCIYDSEFIPKRRFTDLTEKRFVRLPNKLKEMYHETILAYNNEMPILAASGLRALIEGICDDKGIKGNNIETKINGLASLLPENIVSNLHGFRFLGNVALHELAIPDLQNISIAIEVAEDLLNLLYDLDYKSSRLPKNKDQAKEKREWL